MKPGDVGYLGAYQRALTMFCGTIDEEGVEKARATASTWNMEGPLPEKQARYDLAIMFDSSLIKTQGGGAGSGDGSCPLCKAR